jgi:hypothetical protein
MCKGMEKNGRKTENKAEEGKAKVEHVNGYDELSV